MLNLEQGSTVICTALDCERQAALALESRGASIHYLATGQRPGGQSLLLSEVMSVLAQRQYNDVLLEAGANLTGAMLQAGYVDELVIYMAAHRMGSEARGLFNLPGLNSMSERIGLTIDDIRAVGKDFRITARVG